MPRMRGARRRGRARQPAPTMRRSRAPAHKLAHVNFVWGQTPAVDIDTPSTPSCPDAGRSGPCQLRAGRTSTATASTATRCRYSSARWRTSRARTCRRRRRQDRRGQRDQLHDAVRPCRTSIPTRTTGGIYDAGDTYTAPTPDRSGHRLQRGERLRHARSVLKGGLQSSLSPGWFQATDIGGNGAARLSQRALKDASNTIYWTIGDMPSARERQRCRAPTQQVSADAHRD